MDADTLTNPVLCANCGTANAPGAAFCARCGSRLDAALPDDAAQRAVPPPPAAPSARTADLVGSARTWIRQGGQAQMDEIGAHRRFPDLQIAAGLFKVSAIVTAVWGVLALVGRINVSPFPGSSVAWDFNPLEPNGAANVFALGGPLLAALLLWTIGSIVLLLLDIEVGIRNGRGEQ